MNRDKKRTYNGWTNYETHAVSLWINNEEGSYRFWKERTATIRGEEQEKNSSEEVFSQAACLRLANELKEVIHAECDFVGLGTAGKSIGNWRPILRRENLSPRGGDINCLDTRSWREICRNVVALEIPAVGRSAFTSERSGRTS